MVFLLEKAGILPALPSALLQVNGGSSRFVTKNLHPLRKWTRHGSPFAAINWQ